MYDMIQECKIGLVESYILRKYEGDKLFEVILLKRNPTTGNCDIDRVITDEKELTEYATN